MDSFTKLPFAGSLGGRRILLAGQRAVWLNLLVCLSCLVRAVIVALLSTPTLDTNLSFDNSFRHQFILGPDIRQPKLRVLCPRRSVEIAILIFKSFERFQPPLPLLLLPLFPLPYLLGPLSVKVLLIDCNHRNDAGLSSHQLEQVVEPLISEFVFLLYASVGLERLLPNVVD